MNLIAPSARTRQHACTHVLELQASPLHVYKRHVCARCRCLRHRRCRQRPFQQCECRGAVVVMGGHNHHFNHPSPGGGVGAAALAHPNPPCPPTLAAPITCAARRPPATCLGSSYSDHTYILVTHSGASIHPVIYSMLAIQSRSSPGNGNDTGPDAKQALANETPMPPCRSY